MSAITSIAELIVGNTFANLDQVAMAAFLAAGNDLGPTEAQMLTAARAGDAAAVKNLLRTVRRIEAAAKEYYVSTLPALPEEVELFPGAWVNLKTTPRAAALATWVWRGFLRTGLPGLIVGHGESGKGIFTSCLALCIAAGEDYLGHPTSQGKVLVVSAEDDLDELNARFHDIAAAMGLDEDWIFNNIEFFSTVNAGVAPSLLAEDMSPTILLMDIARKVSRLQPKIVILDTLAAMAPPKAALIDATVATQYICTVVANLRTVEGSAPPAVLFTHHLRKPDRGGEGRPSIHDVRDSGAIVGSMRSVMIFHKDTLTLDKCNGRMRVEPVWKIGKADAYQLQWKAAAGCHNGALMLKGKADVNELAEADRQAELANVALRAERRKQEKADLKKSYWPKHDSQPVEQRQDDDGTTAVVAASDPASALLSLLNPKIAERAAALGLEVCYDTENL